jgi:hypothetical protein
VRIVNAPDVIVVSPKVAERPGAVPMRRAGDIVVSRVNRSDPRERSRDPKRQRGQIVDILV